MEKYENFIAKHGEVVVQAILEGWEQFVGLTPKPTSTIEDRWTVMMTYEAAPTISMAA